MTIHRPMDNRRHASPLPHEQSRDLVHRVRNLAMVAVYALDTIAQQSPASARAKHELVERSIMGMVDLVESTLVPAKAGRVDGR